MTLDAGRKAHAYAIRAAEDATRHLAYEDAAVQYARALEMLGPDPQGSTATRCKCLIGLGEAQMRSGERDTALRTFDLAIECARELRSGAMLARIALGRAPGLISLEVGRHDVALGELLEEAINACPDDPELRAQLLARLAVARAWCTSREDLCTLLDEALADADRSGSARAHAFVRGARCVALWCPSNLDARSHETIDALLWAVRAGDRELEALARLYRIATLMEAGRIRALREEIETFERMAHELRQPHALWYETAFRVTWAYLEGRFADVRRLSQQLQERVHGMQLNARHHVVLHEVFLCVEQGHFERALDISTQMASIYPGYLSNCAWMLAELGRVSEARAMLDVITKDDLAGVHHDLNQLAVIAALTEACEILDDSIVAAKLYDLLLPYRERVIVIGYGYSSWGSAARTLAQLATILGRWHEAEQLFELSLELNARLGARTWVVRSHHGMARMLLRRGHDGDNRRARHHIEVALASARAVEMTSMRTRLETLERQLDVADASGQLPPH